MVIVLDTGEGLVEILIEGLFVSIKQKSWPRNFQK
jgi:hypothetical protein